MLSDTIAPRESAEVLLEAEAALEAGKWKKTEQLCTDVLRSAPEAAAAHLLGRAYEASGQTERAAASFRQAIEFEPETADYYFSLARLLQQLGQTREAAEAWVAGILIDPSRVETHLALSDALKELSLYDLAVTAARQALLVDPECVGAFERMGQAYELSGDLPQAMAAWERCVALEPESADHLRHLAKIVRSSGDPMRAAALLRRVIELRPRDPGDRFLLAGALADSGLPQPAIEHLREATRMQPRFPEAWSNLGLLLRAESRFADAEACYRKATSQNAKFAAAWNNLGNLYVELSRESEAEICYTKAIAANQDYAEAHTSRAMLRLLKGRFAEGWEEYEWRWKQPGVASRTFARPEWNGGSLDGKTILLHAEQGAGDTIQFIRYARLLKRGSARVVLHCPASLRSLMEAMAEVDVVVCGRETLPVFDVHAPLMSLPRLFGTDARSIPEDSPYLHVPPGVEVPQSILTAPSLRVGLVWAGNPHHRNDRNRSIDREAFAAILGTPGVTFFSLQVGGDAKGLPVVDLAPHLHDYGVTAACLQELDLLISVDTSVVHLAGALGRPVWMLLPTCNDWRWLLDRSDSPWYRTLRIFRQHTLGDWSRVLAGVSSELQRLASAHKSAA